MSGVTAPKGSKPPSPGSWQIRLHNNAVVPPIKIVTGNRELWLFVDNIILAM